MTFKRRSSVEAISKINLTEHEWAYLAGFIDGDGHISIAVALRKYSYPLGCVEVTIDNKDKRIHEWLRTKIPYVSTFEKRTGFGSVVYRSIIRRRPIVKVILENISKYVVIRRRQVEIGLKFIDLVDSVTRSSTLHVLRKIMDLKRELDELNKTKIYLAEGLNESPFKNEELFWAYLAGLIDVDGTVFKRKDKTNYRRWVIAVSTAREAIVDLLNLHNIRFAWCCHKDRTAVDLQITAKEEVLRVARKILNYSLLKREVLEMLLKELSCN